MNERHPTASAQASAPRRRWFSRSDLVTLMAGIVLTLGGVAFFVWRGTQVVARERQVVPASSPAAPVPRVP